MYTSTKDENIRNLKNSPQNYQDAAKDMKEDAHNAVTGAGRKVLSFFSNAGEEISHAKETVTTQIRTNPVQSSVVALGVGFVLGALFRR